MAGVIRNPSRVDQRAVIRFLTAEGCQPVDIHRRMQAVYGDRSMLKATVANWTTMFKEGRELTKDLPIPAAAQNTARMSGPTGHDRSTKPIEDVDDEEDPVEAMINKTGCLKLHYAVQECIGEKKDWRECQKEVTEFRKCIEAGMKKKLKR